MAYRKRKTYRRKAYKPRYKRRPRRKFRANKLINRPRTAIISNFKDLAIDCSLLIHGFTFSPADFNGDNKLNNIKARYDRYTCNWMKLIIYMPKPNSFL